MCIYRLVQQSVTTLSYRTNGREMCSSPIVTQAKRSRELKIYLVFCIVMFLSSVSAYPSKRQKGPKVIDRGNVSMMVFQRCQPVDPQHLLQRMGSSFDGSRMALDEESVKRSALQERSLEDDEDDSFDDSTDDVDDFDSSIDQISASRSKRNKDTLDIHKWTDDPKNPAYLESMKLMRRKRDVHLDYLDESDDENDRTFYQQLMQTNFKKSHRLSKRSANKSRKKDKLPWSCKMKKHWLRMEKGYFPEFIRSGKCKTKKCFYNTKECIPKKYTIKVLRRDPDRCNPVPRVGINSTYEEVWFFERQHVTVWCECGNPRNKKRRRKDRTRKSRP